MTKESREDLFVIEGERFWLGRDNTKWILQGLHSALYFRSVEAAQKWIEKLDQEEYRQEHDEYSRPDYSIIQVSDLSPSQSLQVENGGVF